MVDRKVSRLGYDNVPREYQNIRRAGSRPRDRFDEMFKTRVTAGQVPGDAGQRIANLEKRAAEARGTPAYGPICSRLQRERFKLQRGRS
jgi:hypothetical protein